MEIVLILMFSGMGVGWLISKQKKIIKVADKFTTWAIYILLFLLGISIGQNEKIISNLNTIGLQALLLTLGAVIGSLFTAWFTYHYFFKKNSRKTK